MSNRIRTTKHKTTYSNKNKVDNLQRFIKEYQRVAQLIVDDMWTNGYDEFNIQMNSFVCPKYIDYNRFNIETTLTARALSSLVTQVCGILKASVEKQKKRLYVYNKQKAKGYSKKKLKPLIRKIKQNIPQKPDCSRINAELSSKCADWQTTNGEFDGFLNIKSIFTDRSKIRIPVKHHKHSCKIISEGGSLMGSFLINTDFINLRWELPKIHQQEKGKKIGCDQGYKDVLTCSDKQVTPKTDIHGHSLESILAKLSRKKKGSRAFKRSQNHRQNFINWSVNQIDLTNIKEIGLERIWNIRYKTRSSRKMSHWTNTLIRDKVEQICEDNGVRLTHQSSTYRSQRCSVCGTVRKANRKGKIYSCKHCGLQIDADLNASLNHEIYLPEIPYALRKLKLNRGSGFLWNPEGFFDFSTGRSLESLLPEQIE